jgi:hypothetical protein
MAANLARARVEIEQVTGAGHGVGIRRIEKKSFPIRGKSNGSVGATISRVVDTLEAGHGAGSQELQNSRPIERRFKRQRDHSSPAYRFRETRIYPFLAGKCGKCFFGERLRSALAR